MPDGSTHSGAWWLELCTCENLYGAYVNGNGHPIWQFSYPYTAKAKSSAQADNVGLRVQKLLSEESFGTLEATGNTAGGSKKFKLHCHHVSLNADLARRDTVPLPLDAGRGSSVDRQCDGRFCVKRWHVKVTPLHRDNLSRQRCPGVSLLAFWDEIIQEEPCDHGQGLTKRERLEDSCCRNIRLTVISEESAAIVAAKKNGATADPTDDLTYRPL